MNERLVEHAHTDSFVFPASFGQSRLWFLCQLEPDSAAAYHVRAALEIRGPLDRVVLQSAFDQVVARHESLRTGVALIDGEPHQVILPEAVVAIPTIDCGHLEPDRRQPEVARVLEREASRAFTLDQPPLIRLVLVRLSDSEHVLGVVVHHIVCDGWSLAIFLRELAAAYARIGSGAEPAEELPIHYADYSVWQRELLSGRRLDALLDHWCDRLAGLPTLDLPTDHPRPAIRSARGGVSRVRLPAEFIGAVDRLAARCGATRFMVVLAMFTMLLGRYSGQTDVAVGTAVANRGRSELEELIGLFANTLVLRTDLGGDPTVGQLVHRVRRTCLDAFTHQDLPFERLVEQVRPPRDLSRTPLFQTMFLLQSVPTPATVLDGLTFTPTADEIRTAKYDLTLVGADTDDGFELRLEYSADLFDPATVELMLNQLITLLRGAIAAPDALISTLDMVDDAQRALVEGAWATGPARQRTGALVHELVAAQARRTPAAVAVEAGAQSLTYGELVEAAAALAARLRAFGVAPGEPVGVLVDRSTRLASALLAVLTADAAYLPLDPEYPADRIASMLADARARLVLVSAATRAAMPAGDWAVLDVGETRESAATSGRTELAVAGPGRRDAASSADKPAYVIYTSGSTGRPKGVQIGHSSFTNYLLAMAELLGVGEADVLAAVTSVSFDIAGTELFLPLVTGGRVVVIGPDTATDGGLLAGELDARGATLMQATPATWRLLLAAGWQPTPRLRMLCGGEALSAELAGRLLAAPAPGRPELWNLYGPTEATIWATGSVVRDPSAVRLGDPLANVSRYVLDGRGRGAAIGTPGELFLGGSALAHGYLGRPALTAERFVPDPFAERPGERLYRTGDLCRYRPDGSLEFLGRIDDQVKVRGFRIEPGEIESVLAGHPWVSQVTVVAHQVAADDVRLVAHVVAAPQAPSDEPSRALLVEQLRERATGHLPAHMKPSRYQLLDAMPLTPAGKVDRAALRRASPAADVPAVDDVPPRNPTERTVARVFAEVLGAERVGVHASFFDLGGHSLLAATLVARLQAETGVHLMLRDLFHRPTVAAVAEAIATRQSTAVARREEAGLRAVLTDLSDAEVEALLRQANE